ncbi:MAG: bifunctional protein-serine/threonine kinase/phosphatase [Sulfurimonas sp.]|uniref:bifunctional protein-serine/threonine kinase/phosphatase n=1 Tax=Sulfurimonas sp. TaxID=2022749 RepID=UPI00261D43E5|nr:bifunctional protein-serine/threonine kinase/phosphatase [Sulfurimonas sp.]MDD2652233.1 bifunctional protein-serine/threonine kinase/phosphatase [Sulfurimonas sp.]MDD3450485.1 bifunctional protein-serine/threonine kinase/phosphatase [Sulfurimonas sp.]
MKSRLELSISQYSTEGRKEINQDFHDICIPQEPQLTHKGVAIAIADGIGSSSVSQIASKTAVTSFLMDYLSTPDAWSVKKSALRVLGAANSWLHSQTMQSNYSHDKNRGYVCTFSAMVLRSSSAYIFHAGDTRIYRLREGVMEQLTQDHRLWVSREESYLSRALGMEPHVRMDYSSFSVEVGDIFLFMSDGVYEFVSDAVMAQTVQSHLGSFENAAQTIGETAFEIGSDDNITIQLVRVDALPKKEVKEIYKQLEEKPFAPLLEAREEFEGYTIVRELSASNRSHVYLGVDKESGASVVLKIPSIDMRGDKAYLERFLMEEWVARRINSANVLKAFTPKRKKNYLYNTLEYVEGQTLSQWIIDNPHPSLETVRQMAEQIAKGLLALHRQEMLHQDLRPQNIMIDASGTLKIIDFGATRVEGIMDINIRLEQENLLGTALYSAPEYFLGKDGTTRSDLFSLGVIVYEMLCGHFPYGVEVARVKNEAAQKRLRYTPLYRYNQEIPVWVDEAVKKAVAIKANERYEELSEFLYDLRHPNEEFLKKKKPPLVEKNSVVFWQGVSFVLAVLLVFSFVW